MWPSKHNETYFYYLSKHFILFNGSLKLILCIIKIIYSNHNIVYNKIFKHTVQQKFGKFGL